MQRFHASAEHFRPARQFGHIAHGNARVAQQLRRSARRDDFDSKRRKLAREIHNPGLIVNADERPLDQ